MNTWKSIIRNVAPVLGTALGGPMAGTGTKFIANELLGKPDAHESDIEQAVMKASPEELAKLKTMDTQFKLEMQKLNIDVYKLETQDRAGARQMYKLNVWPQILLSGVFVIGYFLVLFFLIENPDTLSKDRGIMGVFTTVLGVLTAAIPQILSFWFGSRLHHNQDTKKAV